MLSRRRFLFTAAASAPALALHAQDAPPDPSQTLAAQKPTHPTCDDTLPAPILALKDRSKDIVPITKDERQTRLDLARELMKQYGMDAILITSGASLRYFTGFDWPQTDRLFAYILPQSAAPFLICPIFERQHLNDDYLLLAERETTITYLWEENEDPFSILQRALAQYKLDTGTIGIEEQVPYACVSSIAYSAPSLKLVSATPVTAGCRTLKSPAELALLHLANAITFDVLKAVYLSCQPGDTNQKFLDLTAKAYALCGVSGETSCNTGAASALLHHPPAPQTIKEDEIVLLQSGCSVEGYQSDISRCFVYGKASDFQRQIFETVANAQSAALAISGPGVEMQFADAAARKVIVDAGYGPDYQYFTHRLGHGIGLNRHEWPYLVGGNNQKMLNGMTFCIQPCLYIPGKFGIRLGDTMHVINKGAELLTTQSPSLQDPFSIPAILPAKPDTTTPPSTTKPAETAPASTPSTTQNPTPITSLPK
jgi:Xaa-Pro dipeptidase